MQMCIVLAMDLVAELGGSVLCLACRFKLRPGLVLQVSRLSYKGVCPGTRALS